MFDNVGGKLKGLAIVVFVIGIIAAVIYFLVMIRFSFIGGLLTGGLMFLASWLGVLGIYALGEAAERGLTGYAFVRWDERYRGVYLMERQGFPAASGILVTRECVERYMIQPVSGWRYTAGARKCMCTG